MTVGVGVVGVGFMGTAHSRAHSQIPSARLVAIADTERERAAGLARQLKCRAYGSLDEMLRDPEVQIVDVTLPTYLHADAAVRAAEAGKHVICEKPMALTTSEADRMIRAARRHGVELMVAHVIRFWPEWAFLAEKVKSGEFGKVRVIRCVRLSSEPRWAWKMWLLDVKKSGGPAIDLHIHDVDFILSILGRPKSVVSTGTIGHIFTTYHYGRNTVATAEGGWFPLQGYPFVMSYECFLDRATVKYSSDASPTLSIFRPDEEPYSPSLASVSAEPSTTVGNIADIAPYYEELKYFVGCIDRGEKPSRIRPEEARESLEVCLAEIRSLKTGRRIRL